MARCLVVNTVVLVFLHPCGACPHLHGYTVGIQLPLPLLSSEVASVEGRLSVRQLVVALTIRCLFIGGATGSCSRVVS